MKASDSGVMRQEANVDRWPDTNVSAEWMLGGSRNNSDTISGRISRKIWANWEYHGKAVLPRRYCSRTIELSRAL